MLNKLRTKTEEKNKNISGMDNELQGTQGRIDMPKTIARDRG